MKQILVVDDEARIRDVVHYALEREGYEVSLASNGAAALAALEERVFDLAVLDVMLPDIDGLEICRRIRARGQTLVLFLSARSEEVDRVVGLEIGGDDYLTKPFSPRELVARVRATLRRVDEIQAAMGQRSTATAKEARSLQSGPVTIDIERHEVRFEGRLVELTATEISVLASLYERPGVVLSRAQLMARAYSGQVHVTERTIDTHIRRIRAKFRAAGGDPIATVHGLGYKAAGA